MKKILLLVLISLLSISATPSGTSAAPLSQVTPPADPDAYRLEQYNAGGLTSVVFIFDNGGVVTYEEQAPDGTVLVNRSATAAEENFYIKHVHGLRIAEAENSLTGNPEGGGNVYETWVANRTAELQSCQDDMGAGIAVNFNDLGVNAQNNTIRRMQECIQTNSRVHKQVIKNLYELLLVEDILEANIAP